MDMRTSTDQTIAVSVVLSRRNLLSLLAKLDQNMEAAEADVLKLEDMSAVTIRRHTEAGLLTVRGEEDFIHYGHRTPGPMSDRTESALEA
jgi:hypothetical protein